MKLVLFDIDGTLITSGQIDRRATNAAFERVFGVAGAFAEIVTDGRTVTWVLEAALRRTARTASPDDRARWKAAYLEALAREIDHAGDELRLLPGAAACVADLAGRADVRLGLITGNYREAAKLKLEPVGLWPHFAFGGFGDDGAERADLVPAALGRARALGGVFDLADVTIVGDTAHDVRAAEHHRVAMIAVATGPYEEQALRAAGAACVVASLSEMVL